MVYFKMDHEMQHHGYSGTFSNLEEASGVDWEGRGGLEEGCEAGGLLDLETMMLP